MQDTELRLSDLFVLLLRKWRCIVCVGLVLALCLGGGTVAMRLIELNDPEQMERLQAEYEAAYSQYWDAIEAVDRKIRNNENYIEQSKVDLENLVRKKENYEYDIEDLKADIEYYSLQVIDMEKNIEVLKTEKENAQYRLNYRNEQNESSLLMAIDPYEVQTSEVFLRVDSGYQIIPGSSYQDPDPTDELLQTYRLMVANAEFYEKMIRDLKLNTEVRYLNEVVSVSAYSTNSLRVKVIGCDQNQTRQMAQYISDAIEQCYDEVCQAVSQHTLELYATRNYAIVDMEIYDQQQEYVTEATELEGLIRQMDADILSTQADIRQTRADMREFEDDIEQIRIAIANIPVREEELNEAIATYRDEVNLLRLERMDLLKQDEPVAPGITFVSGLIRFVKFALIGGIVGVLVAMICIIFSAIARGKVLSARQVASMGVASLGVWPIRQEKRFLSGIDRWVCRKTSKTLPDEALVCANIAASASEGARILVCGGAEAQYISQVAESLKQKYPTMDISTAGSHRSDPKAVEELAQCDAVVLVEKVYASSLEAVYELQERAQNMGKTVLGMVLA